MRKILLFLSAGIFLAATAPLSEAYDYEFGFGWTWNGSAFKTAYEHQFSPVFESGFYTSAGHQTLNIEGTSGTGLGMEFNILFSKNFGVQILADIFKTQMSGVNGPYDLTLTYTNAFPPDYIPVEVVHERSRDWPKTQGEMRQITFSLNGIKKFDLTRTLSLSASGGLSYFYIEGKASYIGYTRFWLTSQLALSSESYMLPYDFGPVSRLGLNGGAGMALSLFSNVSLTLDVRYFFCPKMDARLHLSTDTAVSIPVDSLEADMSLKTMKINPSFPRVSLGMRFWF